MFLNGKTTRALALSIGLAAPVPALAEIYALVVGIDEYRHITPLGGAVNDAVDIASALSSLDPKEMVVLVDDTATRDTILGTWRRFSAEAAPGDTIVMTFAGHGSFEEAVHPEDEPDGRDETLLLSGFAPSGEAASQRIRDNEIAELVALRPDVHHIIIADSCHSGTATRAADSQLTYRFYDAGGIVNDPLPPPPPPPPAAPSLDAINSTLFAAVSESEKSPEIEIDGKIRGALSYAFAEGLRGRADVDEDGVVTKGEMETHIRRFVRNAVNGRQKPQVDPVGDTGRTLFELPRGLGRGEDVRGFDTPFTDLPKAAVKYQGTPPADFISATLSGVATAGEEVGGNLVVDFDAREIRDSNTDLLRDLTAEIQNDTRAQIQLTIDRMRLVYALQDASLDDRIDVFFPFGDELYFEDDALRALISGRRSEHVTVLNFAPDGTVQWLYPRYPPIDRVTNLNDPPSIPIQQELSFDAFVTPPFGAEYILVVQTAEPHPRLRRTAARFDGSPLLKAFWEDARRALEGIPYEVAIQAFYTDDAPPASE